MLDSLGRKIDYLRLSVTDRCNLRCLYCMPQKGVSLLDHGDILTYEEISVVVKAAVELGINKFRITGGEPLIRKDLIKFVNNLSKIKGIEDLSLTTNGIKLKECALALYEASIKRINISLDTLDEYKFEQITRGGNLNDVLNGIEEAISIGFSPIKINVVVIRGINDDEILDFARFSLEKSLEVRFIELMPIGESKFFGREKIVPIKEVQLKCQSLGQLELTDTLKGNGPAKYYKIKRGHGKIGFIAAMTNQFCQACNRLRLTASGLFKPCLTYNKRIDLKPALRPNIDGDKIKILIKEAVNLKPKGHNMSYSEEVTAVSMSSIGG